ncbi:MAG: AAA family ATPase [Merdibacter sp.]
MEKKTIKEGWDSIAGYADVKEELRQVLEPYTDSRLMRKMRESHIDPVKGLLLFGPPGCGKTLFARALASESKMNIISVAGAQFTSKWVGESDRNLRLIFEQARMQAPCILFFDELESFSRRGIRHSTAGKRHWDDFSHRWTAFRS